jgi:hypothetical protein
MLSRLEDTPATSSINKSLDIFTSTCWVRLLTGKRFKHATPQIKDRALTIRRCEMLVATMAKWHHRHFEATADCTSGLRLSHSELETAPAIM